MRKLSVLFAAIAGIAFLALPSAQAGVNIDIGVPVPMPEFGGPYYGYYPGYAYYGGYWGHHHHGYFYHRGYYGHGHHGHRHR
jgi:hypothetical protein